MRRLIKWLILLGILALIGWGVNAQVVYWKENSKVVFREGELTRGPIVSVVNSTGTVKPVRAVSVGSVVSGPIESIYVDFNDEVKKGQLLARVDQRPYTAAVARDRAALATKKAEVERVRAQLQQAKNDERRAKALRDENKNFISDTEMDQFLYSRIGLEQMLAVAEASVLQAKASLDTSELNLTYTEILSPVEGTIIDRKIDPGQTMAASFQTPELFIVAPDLRKEMHIFASVDETDIGLIREAQQTGQPVRFTVDSYPDDLFEGKVFQIRKNSTTVQNVVTYPVVVAAQNPDLKLLPGMTASISFQVGKSTNALKVPNSALRFYPQPKQVRPEDRKLLEAKRPVAGEMEDQKSTARSAEEKAELRRTRNRRHLWVTDGELLRAVEIVIGVSDSQYTEIVSGEIQEGSKVVIGIQPRT